MRFKAFLICYLLFVVQLFSQEAIKYRYETDFLPANFHKNRREEVRKQMPDSSIAVLFTSPVRNRANDVNFIYHQDPDFYYLTGFTSQDAVLMIFKDKIRIDDFTTNEVLFIRPRDKERETWTGRMATLEEASQLSGIENCFLVLDLNSFPVSDSIFKTVLTEKMPKGMVDSKSDTLDLYSLVDIFKKKFNYPPVNGDTHALTHILETLREVKTNEEMVLMRKAIDISCEGHMEMMRAAKPGMTEYQVQAVGEFVFRKLGAEYQGYPSICGSGENSSILHYESNRRKFNDGDLILLDMGGEYHGYTADITRTFPVNGKFSPEQKLIYDLVLAAHDSAMALCKIGNTFQTPHKKAVEIIKEGLVKLGVIDKESEYRTYFMHGTSHYLGLDVHDAGTFTLLKEGNIITIEPGVYIPPNSPCDKKWWNIGVRIEDDVLITATGYENLSKKIPVTTVEIEQLMLQKRD